MIVSLSLLALALLALYYFLVMKSGDKNSLHETIRQIRVNHRVAESDFSEPQVHLDAIARQRDKAKQEQLMLSETARTWIETHLEEFKEGVRRSAETGLSSFYSQNLPVDSRLEYQIERRMKQRWDFKGVSVCLEERGEARQLHFHW